MRIGVALVLVVAACRDPAETETTAPADGCTRLPFATSTPVPEASAAAWIDFGGKPALLVIGDSGNHGAYGIVDADTGETLEQGRLPLGDSSDDLEGLSAHGDLVYGLISAGWVYTWRRVDSHGSASASIFQLVDGPYALGPVDLPKHGTMLGDTPPATDGMVCPAHGSNCGRNYEGLCLAAAPLPNGCAGYVAAKADGHLYCVVADAAGRLSVRRDGAIPVDRPGWIADCTFGDDDTLWVGDNLFGMSQVFRIDGTRAVRFAQIGVGFPEVLAVRGDLFYRMSDTGGAPSLIAKFRSRRAPSRLPSCSARTAAAIRA